MDDLDRSIARRTAKNPRYPEMLQAKIRRQRLIVALIAERKANHLTQAHVAAEMNVSQSVVAEIESSKADVRYSTLDRYAGAVTCQGTAGSERWRPRELHNRGHQDCTLAATKSAHLGL